MFLCARQLNLCSTDRRVRETESLHATSLTLSPTLCTMLRDPLLQERYTRHLNGLIDLAEKEIHRTHWDTAFRDLAWMYHNRFSTIRDFYHAAGRDVVDAFK